MALRSELFKRATATVLLLIVVGPASADRLRFHYVPADACGNITLQPTGPCGSAGERTSWFGSVREPCNAPPRPTHLVTFQHPVTGAAVRVPVALPEGTPRLEYRTRRVIYNYGSYTVEVHFLDDGSVEVIYNNPLQRIP